MSSFLVGGGRVQITIPATESVAVYTQGSAQVFRVSGFVNQPDTLTLLGTVNNTQTVFGSYTTGATIVIEAIGGLPVYYEIGTAPIVKQTRLNNPIQTTPVAVNVTGAVSAAAIIGGIVTSTTAAAVAGTVPTGTVMEATSDWAANESVEWTVIATGANAFTVTAATAHTIVGSAVVATVTSGHFRTVRSAANTFVTYRLA
jgi:hypothetical protein